MVASGFHQVSSSLTPAAPTLRIFDESAPLLPPGERLPHELRLREAFELHFLPDSKELEPTTISLYYTTLGHWERLTTDPPIGLTTDVDFRAFRDAMLKEARGTTVDNNIRRLRTMFRRFGPRSDGNPGGMGFLTLLPYCRSTGAKHGKKRSIPLEELSAVYRACEIATWPSRGPVPAPKLWRTKLVFFYNVGASTVDAELLRWAQIGPGDPDDHQRKDPQRQYVSFVREKTKHLKEDELHVPLNATVLRALLSIRTDDPRVFPCSWTNFRDRKAQWEAILSEAGIPKKRWFNFAHLRKTCNVRANSIPGVAGVGKAILGHAPRDVNDEHYEDWTDRMAYAVDHLPQPDAFAGLDHQRRLFE